MASVQVAKHPPTPAPGRYVLHDGIEKPERRVLGSVPGTFPCARAVVYVLFVGVGVCHL